MKAYKEEQYEKIFTENTVKFLLKKTYSREEESNVELPSDHKHAGEKMQQKNIFASFVAGFSGSK